MPLDRQATTHHPETHIQENHYIIAIHNQIDGRTYYTSENFCARTPLNAQVLTADEFPHIDHELMKLGYKTQVMLSPAIITAQRIQT